MLKLSKNTEYKGLVVLQSDRGRRGGGVKLSKNAKYKGLVVLQMFNIPPPLPQVGIATMWI